MNALKDTKKLEITTAGVNISTLNFYFSSAHAKASQQTSTNVEKNPEFAVANTKPASIPLGGLNART